MHVSPDTAHVAEIGSVLAALRADSPTTHELGARFERLMRAYLRTDPMWTDRFSDVWLWQDWPGRGNVPDTGIDLVAAERDGGTCAIQCKFYEPNHTLDKADIDSFFTASGKETFTSRLIISTTDKWSKHAEGALDKQQIPVQRLRVRDLADSPIDWSQFAPDAPDDISLRARKELRPHQTEALQKVTKRLEEVDRGKLIMACGTGKTFTALRIAETFAQRHAGKRAARVLFLVPSLSLLSQTLREWTAEAGVTLQPFAVCSDVKVGRTSEDISRHDLPFTATTDADRLLAQMKATPEPGADGAGMTVIFSTYQSIATITAAHKKGLAKFDLVICDEAHRTTGATLAGEDESQFVRVHQDAYIKATKRLYMTATPRLFDDSVKAKAQEADALLVSMDDEDLYGPELHRLGFGEAVERGLLTDYKVIVLAVEEKYVAKTFQRQLADENNELRLDDAVKIIGCWNGLMRRHDNDVPPVDGAEPMRRAVAFSRSIKDSKRLTDMFENVLTGIADPSDPDPVLCEARHVDGTFNALRRNAELDWLKAPLKSGENKIRILSNARCLSEGVDVPALDAVMFLNPRNSVVDVVQSVGRVMRLAPEKDYGYIILPIGIPADKAPEEALQDNQKYKVVWQVLQALRAHDDRFNAAINKIELTKKPPQQISVVGVGGGDGEDGPDGSHVQLDFAFPELEEWRDAIYAKIVQKCGDRLYWESWAKDVAEIAERHTARIRAVLDNPKSAGSKAFAGFLQELRSNLNPQIAPDDAVEMLSQHLITRPVFDALFEGYDFADRNPVSQTMQKMLDALGEEALGKEAETLQSFYESVRKRASGVDTDEGRQRIITELYEKFFRNAFPKMADRLGIVYTPVEVVDFIIHSVEHVLREDFGAGLGTDGVHVLDPFTGTGTFIVRLLQSGLIEPDDLLRSFMHELHANEIVLLAYYIAAINIEAAFHQRHGGDYEPFPGVVLTDTFQLGEGSGTELEALLFPENHERVDQQRRLDIRVILGNPPYSVGQESENDANQNVPYGMLDKAIADTYVTKSTAANKNALYDSYIRAIRWASDRIGDHGMVAFVTNGYWIDGLSHDGLRKSLVEEFSSIYCLNLRGNQRGTQGDVSRREAGKIFGGGSRAPVAITVLVKHRDRPAPATLRYHDIGDYLSREDKLALLQEFTSVDGVSWDTIVPNEQGDWINQRDAKYGVLTPLGSTSPPSGDPVCELHSSGIKSNRDAWVYSFGADAVHANVERTIAAFNDQAKSFAAHARRHSDQKPADLVDDFVDRDPKRISWSSGLKLRLAREDPEMTFDESRVVEALYRPFCKQHLYYNPDLLERTYQQARIFPASGEGNRAIVVTGVGARREFSALMVDAVPNYHFMDSGQVFPRYRYEDDPGDTLLSMAQDGPLRFDNIGPVTVETFRTAYGDPDIDADDVFHYVYALLHAPRYRTAYAAELRKMLPRIPHLPNFAGLADAGRRLADLHVGYETADPFDLQETTSGNAPAASSVYRVQQLRFLKGDRSRIMVNSHLTLEGIPADAYAYVVNGKSAIEWMMDRYRITTDKPSGIVNDPNRYSDNPRYIVDLLRRIVTLSLTSLEIMDEIRKLESLEGL
jgi:predicted helicase